ncbi:MAG: GldG family protein [Chloroflexota bacterium]
MSTILRKASPQAGLVGLLAFFGAASYYLVYGDLNVIVEALLAIGVLSVSLYVWGAGNSLGRALTSRQSKRGSNAALMMAVFVVIVGLLNFLAARHSVRWDLTESGTYTLSPQTIQILSNLKNPVKVLGFYTAQSDALRVQAEDLLREYESYTDKVTHEMVDLDQKPTLAQQYQIRAEGLLFLSGGKRQEVLGTSESDFTNGILKLTSAEQKKVGFVVGHGERALDTAGNASYQQAKRALEQDNYATTTVNLLSGPVPDGMAAVILAGPSKPLADQERQTLRDYLKKGGKVMLLYDPGVDAQLDDLLVAYGISMGHDLVIDTARALYPDPGVPVVSEYGWSPITKDLPQTVFPGAAALTTPVTPPAGVTVTPLARTSDKSWATKDPQNPNYKDGDSKGPLTLAAAVEANVDGTGQAQVTSNQEESANTRKTRLVIVGDTDFASDAFLRMAGNQDLFVNSVNWLTQSEDLIAIRPKPPENHEVLLTQSQTNLVWFSSIVLLPLLVLGAGASVWWSRR